MMDIQPVFGLDQLLKVETSWLLREDIRDQYQQACVALQVEDPQVDARNTFYVFGMRACDATYIGLAQKPCQDRFGWQAENCSVTAALGGQTLCFMDTLRDSERQRFIDTTQSERRR
ncbi:MAG: hypothetical protein AAF387_18825 [Pseudomonadota bacterium]